MKSRLWLLAGLMLAAAAARVHGQALQFSNRREVAIPDYATLRIGPLYSTATFSQSAGYRWSQSSGTGTDYLVSNRRGSIREDGSEFPLVSTLDFRNYLLITRNTDLDISVRMSYEHYPMDTQDDEFRVDVVDEGIYGTLSMEYRLTPVVRGTLFENFTWRTDYVDTRGLEDRYGGRAYERIDNSFGTRLDWLLAKNKSLGLTLSRRDTLPMDDEFEDQEAVTYLEGLVYEHQLYEKIVLGAGVDFHQTDYKLDTRADVTRQDYRIFARYNEGLTDEDGLRVSLTDVTTARVGVGYSAGYAAEVGQTGSVVEQPTGTVTTTSAVTNDADSATFTAFASLKTQLRRDVSHQFDYERKIATGYKAPFEIVDSYEYRLNWTGYATQASLFSRYSESAPSSDIVRDYTDWTSGVDINYPLTRIVTLHGAGRYSQRRNTGTAMNEAALALEDSSDYDTWSGRVGTSFNLTKTVTFHTYFMHVERDGVSDDLDYTRDIFEAYLRYTHRF